MFHHTIFCILNDFMYIYLIHNRRTVASESFFVTRHKKAFPRMSDSPAGSHIVYNTDKELINDFKKCMRDPNSLDTAANYLYQSLVDEMILGQVFEMHYAVTTGSAIAMEGEPEDTKPFNIVDQNDIDVFGASNAKIAMECTCPKCDRAVAASRFAPHLEKCMGMMKNYTLA